jgi:hypothetical protein
MSESYLDRPQDDNTPKAHPAFNRGKVSGVRAMLGIIKNIVDGLDPGDGANRSPQVEAARRALLAYRNGLVSEDTKQTKAALEEAKNVVANIKF